MSKALDVKLAELDLTDLSSFDGRIVAIVSSDGTLDQIGRKLNKISKGSLARLVSSDKFEKMKLSDVTKLIYSDSSG